MLESNPPRNSQLETHPNDELGRRLCGRRPYQSDRFPHAFQNSSSKSRRAAASDLISCLFSGGTSDKRPRVRKKFV